MARIETDICIIGGGAGGLSVAAGAVQMGARVVLIEGHRMGGDCLNYGCVPSKALIAAGARAAMMRRGAFGIAAAEPAVDYAAAKDHVAATIAAIAPVDSEERFEGLGVTVLRAWARFTSPRTVQAGEHAVAARRFVIATGSVPLVPPIPGLDTVPYLTNETIFDLRERPGHLVVIGAGPIGLEMAQAHVRLGCEVTVIDGARALGREDPEAAAVVLARLREEGVALLEEAAVTGVRAVPGGVAVETAGGTVRGTHLLLAAGRKAALDRLDLARAGVAHDGRGVIVTPGLRSTTNRRVYAVGDAAGGPMFTHLAGYHAAVVIRPLLFGLPARARTDHIPRATYTDPEIAQVGLTEAEARAKWGPAVEVVRAELHHNDRALATLRTEGFCKVVVHRGRPVGATVVGAAAGELSAFWALALSARLKMSALAGAVLPYPTLAEVNKRAAGAYFAPRLFDNPKVKRVVRFVQRWLP